MCKEVTTNNLDIANFIVLDGHTLNFSGGKYIEIESSVVKDETSET